jgi:hypothetical protein
MLKSNYIQLVKDGTGNRFKDRKIAVHLGLVFEQLLGQLYTAHPDELDFYCKDFTVPVEKNDQFSYATFPRRIMHFSDLKKGCRSINTSGDVSTQFVPVSLLGRKIYPSINVGDKTIGFEVKTNKAIFDNLPAEIKEVVLSLVIPFDQWEMTDDIPTPSGMNEIVIQFAIDSLNGKEIPLNIHKTPTKTPQ